MELKSGKEDGIKENSIEIAKKMLKMGFTLEQISEATSLSKEEIEKIKNN
jgi:predicted transposase/invertase (TIGR01784 family)